MKVMVVASEAVPFIKTGGLGDVTGSLVSELTKMGHEVALFIPYYKEIKNSGYELTVALSSLKIPLGNSVRWCRVMESQGTTQQRNFFIEYDEYYNREPIYNDGKDEYLDNGERFSFFCKASLEATIQLGFKPDIIHCNDWQTALIPYFLKCWSWKKNFFRNTASVLSIHNLGYQGIMEPSLIPFVGFNHEQLSSDRFEAYGKINLLKGGICYADVISTVSPTYAKEILSEPGGNGLSQYLYRRKKDIVGILNGIDLEEWNPKTDPFIPAHYEVNSYLRGKRSCKKALQDRFMLPRKDVPLLGMVGRMADQKGLDLLQGCIDQILSWDIQLVILGSGDPQLERFFGDLPKYYFSKVGTYIGFKDELAHLIEAGSDCFIMPSRYEPCGLNQMYSMRYGTVPIVRGTGGLVDTVPNFVQEKKGGKGFVFYDASAEALKNTIGWAISIWYNDKKTFRMLQRNGMRTDFSWKKAIKSYEQAYAKAIYRNSSG